MGELNANETRLYFDNPEASRAKSHEDREQLLQVTPEGLLEFLSTLLSPTDARAVTRESVEHQVRTTREALAPGDEGWWDDSVAALKPWGFDVSDIRVPVQYWHGRQDQFVPFQHGQWLAEHIPGVDAHLSDDDGHITLQEERLPEVHSWLLKQF